MENNISFDRYIEMCREAKEVQTVWVPKDGDVFYVESGYWADDEGDAAAEVGEIITCGHGDYPLLDYPDGQTRKNGSKFSYDKGNYLWLPRVGDLITMVKAVAPKRTVFDLAIGFANYVRSIAPNNTDASFNELWIAFLMIEAWDKRWNGSNWEVVG